VYQLGIANKLDGLLRMPAFTNLDRSARVVVAGAGGFIGGALVGHLIQHGFTDVLAVDIKLPVLWYRTFPAARTIQADLSKEAECLTALRGSRYVFNLAADMGGIGFLATSRAACMLSVLINTHMLLAARRHGIERFFYSSSACVYNVAKQQHPQSPALGESDAYPADAEDGYGWEKLFSERMCRHFSDDFGLPTRVARYHNVYGPYGTYEGGREKAPAAICRKVAEAILSGREEIEIWGDGEQTRSFMYIDDCIEGTMRIMQSDDFREPLNLGSDHLVTINQLVSIIEQIAGVTLKRRYLPDAPLGVRGRNSDNTLLEPGLENTYRWIFDEIAKGSAERSSVRAFSKAQ
jgi:nucleoside-diphosphate-sugar epimerase